MKMIDVRLPEGGVDLYESKHREGDVVREHHHDIYQILYAIEGEGRISLAGRGCDFCRDRAAIIPPFTRHTLVSDSSLTLLVLAFQRELVDTLVPAELREGLLSSAASLALNPFTGSEVRSLLRKMLFEHQRPQTISRWAVRIHLQELILLLARHRQPMQVNNANRMRAERIREYIDTHYFER